MQEMQANVIQEYANCVTENNLIVQKNIKRALEALFFASAEPLSIKKLRQIIEIKYPVDNKALTTLIAELQEEYTARDSAFHIDEIANGFILRTKAEFSPFIEQLIKQKKPSMLSQSLVETLAIIAYKQPITKAQIEEIRGVDCSHHIYQLIEKKLVQVNGKLDAPGRPSLYATTEEFLIHFGLKNLKELKKTMDNLI